MKSVFTDKKTKPGDADLKKALGSAYTLWKELEDFTHKTNPAANGNWHFSGDKYGWSFRISDKKRVIIYLLPRDGFFKTAFVFGQKATDEVLNSKIADTIKKELAAAKPYAEGRGIRIEVKNKTVVKDIKKLVEIKVGH